MTKIMSTPSGWKLSPTNAKNHVFFCEKSFRVEDSDSTKKSKLSLPMNPRCLFDEKLVMAQQAQSVFDRMSVKRTPSREEFKSRLKTTPFVYPNAKQAYLLLFLRNLSRFLFCTSNHCFLSNRISSNCCWPGNDDCTMLDMLLILKVVTNKQKRKCDD